MHHKRGFRRLAACLVSAALVAAACSGDDDGSGTDTDDTG